MCPDKLILSAWADGEVPAPWNDRVREHLESCPRCRDIAASYAALGPSISAAAAAEPSEAELRSASARVWSRLEPSVRASAPAKRPVSMLTRSLPLPLPVAAAAAAAFVALGGALFSTMNQNQALRAAVFTSNEIPARTAQPVGMESFMQYLENQNAHLTITVQLPSETKVDTFGKPVIMKAPGGSE